MALVVVVMIVVTRCNGTDLIVAVVVGVASGDVNTRTSAVLLPCWYHGLWQRTNSTHPNTLPPACYNVASSSRLPLQQQQ